MNNLEKILLLFALGGISYLFFIDKTKAGVPADIQGQPNNVPWYLNYNMPTGFNSGYIQPLPINSIGQENVSGGAHCASCSLFPYSNSGQI
jgi:hypothetical protein